MLYCLQAASSENFIVGYILKISCRAVGRTDSRQYRRKADSLTGDRSTPLQRCVYKLYTHRDNAAYCERLLANFEVDAEQELGRSRTFVKLGPMLGLMGTLIPMGPALVGLATGDIASMAYNMQVAFATTVVGMVIAAIGVVTLQIRQRWYAREINDLEFISKTLIHGTKQTSTQPE